MPGDLFTSIALTQISLQQSNRNRFLAPFVAPLIMATKQTGKIWRIDKEQETRRASDTQRAPGAEPNLVDLNVDQSITFDAKDHSLSGLVTDEERDQAEGPLDPKINKTEFVTDKIRLGAEIELVTELDAVLTGVLTSAVSAPWSNKTSGDPINDINSKITTIKGQTGVKPNAMALDEEDLRNIMQHPDYLDRMKYTTPPAGSTSTLDIAASLVAQMTGLTWVGYADVSMKNTAEEGDTPVLANIWASAYLFHREPNPGFRSANAAVTVGYTGVTGGVLENMTVKTMREEKKSSDLIMVHSYYDMKVLGDATDKPAAHRLTGI